MGIVFDKLRIPYNNQGLTVKNGRVRITEEYDKFQIYYLDDSDTYGLIAFDIDLDVITDLQISLSHTFFELSGSINDSDVILKLSKGEKIINREFFFNILRLQYYKLKKTDSIKQDFYTITGIYMDATTKISEAITATRENKNFTLESKPCILKSENLFYDVSECTISLLEKIEDYCFKSYYNSVSVILGDCLGKSTIGAQVVVDNFKKKEWKINGHKLVLGTALVICDLQDVDVYTKKFSKYSLKTIVIKNFKQFNALTYLDFSNCDTIVLSSSFLSSFSKKNDLVKYIDRTVVDLDMLFDKNFINRGNVDLSIIKFDIAVIDIEDTSRLITRLSKLSYTTCIKLCNSANSIPNTYDTCLTLDYSKASVSSATNFFNEDLKLTKKENILLTESSKRNHLLKDLFLLSPAISALFCGVKIQVANNSREVSIILKDGGANYFENQECPICFEKSEDKIVALCGHSFCPNCAKNSFIKKPACPMCRSPVFNSNYIYLTEEEDSDGDPSSLAKKIIEFCTINRNTNCIVHTSSKLSSESVAQLLADIGIDSVICNITKNLQQSMNSVSKNKRVLITYFEEGNFKKFKISCSIDNILLLPESESIESRKFITRLSRSGSNVTRLFTS